MTVVRVRLTPNGVPTPGSVQFQMRNDTDLRPLTVGRDVLNGTAEWEPVPVEGAEIEVPASTAGFHYVVRFKPDGQPQSNGTFLVPPNGPVDVGDLVRYDPKAGMAYEPDPDWWAHLAGVEVGFEAVQADVHAARDEARYYALRTQVTFTIDPENKELGLVTFPAFALSPDQTSITVPIGA